MTTALTTVVNSLAPAWSKEEADIIRQTLCPGATDAHLRLFAHVANSKGLSPFANQISMQIRNTKQGPRAVFITHIDGYRAKAARTGQYAGSDDYEYEEAQNARNPTKARCTVWRLVGGERRAFTSTVRWAEFSQRSDTWDKMPFQMLGKCAEAQALRKAFPEELGDLRTEDEMGDGDGELVTAEVVPPAPTAAQLNEARAKPSEAPKRKSFEEQRASAFTAFKSLGIEGDELLRRLKRERLEDVTADDLRTLAGWYDDMQTQAPEEAPEA